MTLSERNTFFKAGIAFCAVCALLLLAASILIMPHYKGTDASHNENTNQFPPDDTENKGTAGSRLYLRLEDASHRPSGIFHALTSRFLDNNFYAVHASFAVLAVFSLTGMILIYYFFLRTSSPEILYIAIFTMSLSFEIVRLILPLYFIYAFSFIYVRVLSQILLFIRYFGIFSLFAASICSAGLEVQRIRYVVFIIAIAAMIITIGVPIDVLEWDTGLNMATGFNSLFRIIELAVFIITAVSFMITAKNRDSNEYINVAIGIMLALAGRHILLTVDNWIGLLPGISLLAFGMWLLCTKLHKIHLWL